MDTNLSSYLKEFVNDKGCNFVMLPRPDINLYDLMTFDDENDMYVIRSHVNNTFTHEKNLLVKELDAPVVDVIDEYTRKNNKELNTKAGIWERLFEFLGLNFNFKSKSKFYLKLDTVSYTSVSDHLVLDFIESSSIKEGALKSLLHQNKVYLIIGLLKAQSYELKQEAEYKVSLDAEIDIPYSKLKTELDLSNERSEELIATKGEPKVIGIRAIRLQYKYIHEKFTVFGSTEYANIGNPALEDKQETLPENQLILFK